MANQFIIEESLCLEMYKLVIFDDGAYSIFKLKRGLVGTNYYFFLQIRICLGIFSIITCIRSKFILENSLEKILTVPYLDRDKVSWS